MTLPVTKHRRIAGGQRDRHKRQLGERLHTDRQQIVEDAVEVEERIEQLFVLTDQCPHVVVEYAQFADNLVYKDCEKPRVRTRLSIVLIWNLSPVL